MKYKIIGNMTGNSMDAIDLVLTEFDGDKMSDICSYTRLYNDDMRNKTESLRQQVFNKTAREIVDLSDFKSFHDEYIRQIADCINEMCYINKIGKKEVDAIGFHGKTLDHNPPSKSKLDGTKPYTLQIGSGKMLADLTEINTIYDFRSDFIMNGFDGAPLAPLHNAHIAYSEGDGCYYNGGNTSNFAIIKNGKALSGADAGPFNEYIDAYIRKHTTLAFDEGAKIGMSGKLNKKLLQKLFDIGRKYYETKLPKSGDPAYYYKNEVFDYVEQSGINFADAVHTFEYFAAYIATQALTLVPETIDIPSRFVLFGGGWKNPLVRRSFKDFLVGEGYVLDEHKKIFEMLQTRLKRKVQVINSTFGEYMEARLFADLARYKLEGKAWIIPEIKQIGKQIICGVVANPDSSRNLYDDMICRAAKGWSDIVIKQ
ncbi:MAG: anhydro-N-acetylmuramic acid kinase [Alphaproteobacteria bacterium]|nr:anhydro-N-acetylmuramic acid kinase [Alphaproteobacteria bacterium]